MRLLSCQNKRFDTGPGLRELRPRGCGCEAAIRLSLITLGGQAPGLGCLEVDPANGHSSELESHRQI